MDFTDASMGERLKPLLEAIRRGNYGPAIAGLKQYLTDDPRHEIALGLLASVYSEIGMFDHARELYEQLLAAHPENALARFHLGLIHLGQDPQRALDIWEPLLAVENEFMVHFHGALAHLQLGRPTAAKPLLDHAAKYMPAGHPLRDQLLQTLARVSGHTAPTGYRQ